MKCLLILMCLVSTAYSVSFFEIVMEEWDAWKQHHIKNYSSVMEEKFRMKIFMENKLKIAKHNQRAHKGEKAYFLKMNHYGDLVSFAKRIKFSFFLIRHVEFRALVCSLKISNNVQC